MTELYNIMNDAINDLKTINKRNGFETIKINGREWHSWRKFLKVTGLKNRKSIYDWVRSGKAEAISMTGGAWNYFSVVR